MAKGDVRIIDLGGRNVTPVRTFPTRTATTAINAGEPVVIGESGTVLGFNPYVVVLTNNKPLTTADYFIGIAASTSTHSSSADGYVDVYLDLPGTVYAAKAKTTTTFNTQKLVDNQTFYRIVFDLTSSTYTASVAADSATRGLMILGGEPNTYTVYFAALDSVRWSRSIT